MDTYGQHLLLDVWLSGERVEDQVVERISRLIRRRFNVVNEAEKAFVPQGLTRVFILSESHFTIHTYPEHAYLSMDLYICDRSVDLHAFKRELLALMPGARAQSRVLERGRISRAPVAALTPQAELL